MTLREAIAKETDSILAQRWTMRDGNTVPTTETVLLSGGGVGLVPTMLYADLADSTGLAMKFDRRVAAKVIKAFLSAACRIIRAHDGHIRSFDGDRVMGVFLGETPNTNAAKAALKINWTVIHLLRPKIEAAYPALSRGGYELKHCVGIDRSEVLVVRSGVREHNDLIWVGRAPNIAAKLAAFRTNHPTYITHDAYSRLHEDVKLGGDPRRSMWEERSWTNPPSPELARIYRSNFWWSL